MATGLIPAYHGVRGISRLIRQFAGNAEQFVQFLLQETISHISYSSIVSVEFCRFCTYLVFVLQITHDPVPLYFVKGKALHQAAAIAYGHLRGTGTIDPQAVAAAAQSADAEIQCHLLYAVTLLILIPRSDDACKSIVCALSGFRGPFLNLHRKQVQTYVILPVEKAKQLD